MFRKNATSGDVLSRVEIRAPIAGTIEEKHFAQSDRVRPSDAIFVLADTKSLWVVADIREQDWAGGLRIEPGQEISSIHRHAGVRAQGPGQAHGP